MRLFRFRILTPAVLSGLHTRQVTQLVEPIVTSIPRLHESDPGVVWLKNFDGLFIRQSLDALEVSSCEPTNRFSIAPIVRGADLPNQVTASFTYPLRAALDTMPVLTGREKGSACYERTFCPLSRGFTMEFTDPDSATFFTVERPFVWEPCCCWPFFFTEPQNLMIKDKVRATAVASAMFHPAPSLLAFLVSAGGQTHRKGLRTRYLLEGMLDTPFRGRGRVGQADISPSCLGLRHTIGMQFLRPRHDQRGLRRGCFLHGR